MRVIGMISGTSFDAIEAVAAELSLDGPTLVADLRRARLRASTRRSCTPRSPRRCPPPRRRSRRSAGSTPRSASGSPRSRPRSPEQAFGGEADVVCSHGQTVYHWVEGAHALGTLQLGQPAFIAERTGATVVGDVRARDVAAGGHGAPLASLLDVLLLGREPGPRARLAQPRRHLERDGRRARPRRRSPTTSGRRTRCIDAVVARRDRRRGDLRPRRCGAPPAARSTRQLLAALPRRALLRARAAEVDRQGALPPRVRARATSAAGAIATRRPARDADRALGRDGRGRAAPARGRRRRRRGRRHAQPDADGASSQRRLPGRADRARSTPSASPRPAKEALLFALIGFLTVHRLPGDRAVVHRRRAIASVLGAVLPGRRRSTLDADAEPPIRLLVRTPLPA